MQLLDEVGAGEQLRHRAERLAAEVAIEPGGDHADAIAYKPVHHVDDGRVDELHLVDADDAGCGRGRVLGDLPRIADRMAAQAAAGVADDVARAVAVIDRRLEQRRSEAGHLGTPDAAQQLLALAREHRSADDLEGASSEGCEWDHVLRCYGQRPVRACILGAMTDARSRLRGPRSFTRASIAMAAPASATVLVSTSLIGFSSFAIFVLRRWSSYEALGVVYLPAVLAIAFLFGKRAGLMTAVGGVLLWDGIFVKPAGLRLENSRFWVLTVALSLSAVVVGELAARERRRSAQAYEREREAALLASISSALVGGASLERAQLDAARIAAAAIGAASARIVLGRGPLDGQTALALRVDDRVIGRLELTGVPREIAQDSDAVRVARSLSGVLALAQERERLAAADVEAAALRESDALKTALLRAVSHELRTPLTAIKTTVSALTGSEVEFDAETTTELLRDVSDETDRLDRLVSDLLDVSRLQAGNTLSTLDWCEAHDLVRNAVAAARERVPDVAIEVDLAADLTLVRCDPAQIERVLVNLIENAAKFSPPGRQVIVSARPRVGDRAVFEVLDHGPGIPEDERDRVFEPFYRGTTRGTAGGTGLGLAIARGFVDANHGELTIDDAPGGGACMRLRLPAMAVESVVTA